MEADDDQGSRRDKAARLEAEQAWEAETASGDSGTDEDGGHGRG